MVKRALILGAGRIAKELYLLFKKRGVDICSLEKPEWIEKGKFIKCNANSLDELKIKEEYKLVANTLPSKFNKKVLSFALKNNLNYMDFSIFSSRKAEHFLFKKAFEKKKLIGNAAIGLAPGISNMLVKLARGKEIELYLLENASKGICWNKQDFFYTIKDKAVWIENRRIKRIENFTLKKRKFGVNLYNFYADEVLSLFYTLKLNKLKVWAGGGDIEYAKKLIEKAQIKEIDKEKCEGGRFSIIVEGKRKVKVKIKTKKKNLIAFISALAGFITYREREKAKNYGLLFGEELEEKMIKSILNKMKKEVEKEGGEFLFSTNSKELV